MIGVAWPLGLSVLQSIGVAKAPKVKVVAKPAAGEASCTDHLGQAVADPRRPRRVDEPGAGRGDEGVDPQDVRQPGQPAQGRGRPRTARR